MSTPKRGLGKGLGALIPSAPVDDVVVEATVGAVYAELPLDSITPNPRQPRTIFDDEAMAELVFSIQQVGLLQPVVVRELGGGQYELIAGERRWRACRKAGLAAIPAIIRDTDDDDLLRDALLENLHRADLNPLEEAAAYQQLLADFGCTQEELATRIGRSRPQVTNTLRLMNLPQDVQRRVAAGVLSAGHARALLSLADQQAMSALANRIVAEGLSVRAVEEIILLGDAGERKSRKPSKRTSVRDEQLGDLVSDLTETAADYLETRVTTTGFSTRKAKGKLVIECADVEDLRRIVDSINGG